jgi:hypothetical protein
VILLDELSRAPVTTNNILFPCLEAMELTFLSLFEGTMTEGERGVVAKIFMTR